jgi:diguanylate cyclase (GGDEF)-like protein
MRAESSQDRLSEGRIAPQLDARTWRARVRLTVSSAVILGILWSVGAFWLIWRWEDTRAHNELTSSSKSHLLAVQHGLDAYLAKLSALRALFEANNDATRPQFKAFTHRLLEHEAAIQNFSWVPRVTHADRSAIEQAAARDGIPGYGIKAVSADDRIAPSPERDEYLPVFYSSVRDNSSPIYGIDLRSQPEIRERLDWARDNDALSVVPDFILHSLKGNVHGFLFSLPVYRTGVPHNTVDTRRKNLLGFVHGAFLTAEAFEHIVATSTTPSGLDLYLFSADAASGTRPLHAHPSRLRSQASRGEATDAVTFASVTGGRHFVDRLAAGEAHWLFVAVPIPGGPLDIRHDRAWLVLTASLLIGAISLLHIHTSSRQAGRLLRANAQISELAQTDALTGLMNRRAFTDCLDAAFAACRRGAAPFALLYFDLDHFKDVNDTLGHPIGDRLLRQVAERVKGAIRKSDSVARFGGDEFALLQSEVSDFTTEAVARKINELLATPFVIDGNEVSITASIGIALYTADLETPDALMVQADLALYRAKEDGRDCFRFHSEELDLNVHERVTVAAELRAAIEGGEMRLHYQPQVDLPSGRITGVEALVRWQHPQRGLVGPSEFIPVAERTGSIVALGQWVFEEACRQLHAWQSQGLYPGVMAVNFSAVQLKTQPALARSIAATLARWQIDPREIELELTESVLMEVSQQHSQVFESLREIGVRTAIDDFGTGYSSLQYLTTYPVTRLKIAQDLVSGVNSDGRNATVVRTAIRLAQELGIDCIAEGVETKAQADFLVSAGCESAQGYYCGVPVVAEQMTHRLRQQSPRRKPTSPKLIVVAS